MFSLRNFALHHEASRKFLPSPKSSNNTAAAAAAAVGQEQRGLNPEE